MTTPLDIEAEIVIEKPIRDVWEMMTGEETVPLWLGCLNYQAREGHVFYMQPDKVRREAGQTEGATHCQILEMRAPECFVFSWYLPGMPETTVSITLRQEGKRTRVIFAHTGWDQFNAADIRAIRDALAGGWTSFVLPQLKTEAERA